MKEFGEWKPGSGQHGKIELSQFTTGLKAELFPRLRAAFEGRELRIPASRDIREDLHGIQRIVGMNGQITPTAPRKVRMATAIAAQRSPWPSAPRKWRRSPAESPSCATARATAPAAPAHTGPQGGDGQEDSFKNIICLRDDL